MDGMKNIELLPKLIKFFDSHGGFWSIDSSEDGNCTVEWSPFLGDKGGGMHERIFIKRCYDLEYFIERMNQSLRESGNGTVQFSK